MKDLLIESEVYAAGTTTALMSGRSYNRGVRAHKLCFEAFFRLMWKAFVTWNGKKAEAGNNALNESVQTKLGACREKIGAKATSGAREDFESLQEELKEVIKLLKEFKGEQRPSSKLFAFWEDYGTMTALLAFLKGLQLYSVGF